MAGGEAAALAAKGRALYLAGELAAAEQALQAAVALEPENRTARRYLQCIAERRRVDGARERDTTREGLLHDVERAWVQPATDGAGPGEKPAEDNAGPLARKLDAILLPTVTFNAVDLPHVVATLAAAAEEGDTTGVAPRGVNLVLLGAATARPPVTITLHNLSLRRVLDFITDTTGYQYEVQADAVVLRPGGEQAAPDTAAFPVSRATVLRMVGAMRPAEPQPVGGHPALAAPADESAAVRAFLQLAGVRFDGVEGAGVVYDGAALLVTQTPRNLARIRALLRRYADVRQVEIEAKFLEVQEGALEELGIQWGASRAGSSSFQQYSTANRSVADAFTAARDGDAIVIDGTAAASTAAPTLPGVVPLGAGAAALAQIGGHLGELDVNAVVRALSQKQGSDLLSAPKVTVLSGNPATITIAQELRYPRQYGQIQSQVGQTASTGQSTGSAGVTITAGTPQDFTTENIGVDLRVTPTAEDDGRSITLELHPVVTEFEGFVEYGGPSLAISGGRTVTIPSGFYQPIFSRREVSTRVTVWDGATLVMGGLTREETRKVDDKVPVLGDLPAVGRLFRSKGEGAAKRNLLIFVTANLVSPGGAPKQTAVRATPVVPLR